MKVTIDPHSGFCSGVNLAIAAAERELNTGSELYCLGDIVHNTLEVSRLRDQGLSIISHEEFQKKRKSKVLIRAHGEPPETYRTALQNDLELIDATCPIVIGLQKRIRRAHKEMVEKNGQVVIYGKEGHAEVKGLAGQTDGKAIVIGNENDLDRIDFTRPVRLFSQTTMDTEGFQGIAGQIGEKIKKFHPNSTGDFSWNDTICRQVSDRSGKLGEFAARFEVVIFVSGKKSSNGMYLFERCRSINPLTYLVSGKEDLRQEWFNNVAEVGVCGATSTPGWLLEEIGEAVKSISKA